MEVCSTQTEGIKLLFDNRDIIFICLKSFFTIDNEKFKKNSKQIIYASSTVLLDLTANEMCLEQVASKLKDLNMYSVICSQLRELM